MHRWTPLRRLLAAALVSLAPGSAQAALISVDADPFADGTILNNLFPEIVLSGVGTDTDGNVYARTNALNSTVPKVFGNSSNFDPAWIPSGRALRVDFNMLTDLVSLDVIANDDSDVGSLQAFDSSDVLLDLVTTSTLMLGEVETLTIARGSSDIAYILATGFGGDNVHLDNLRYNLVPEPTSIALIGTAGPLFVGLVWRRRRRG